jgi:pimeloyl-ACP methyl ester carboxylesterase
VPLVELDDIALYYESYGSGPPLLVLGGTSQTIEPLRPLIDGLARHVRVIALENRGVGRTSAPRGRYSIEQMAGDTRALMDALDLRRASALGISMGGRIALALALASPERVDRLALVSTSARAAHPALRLRLWIGMMLGQLRGIPPPNGQQPYAQRAQFWASTRFNCADRVGEIKHPALVVHGRTDIDVPLTLADQMQRGLAGSTYVVLDGGHRISIDPGDRDEVCAAVISFLVDTVA